MNPTTTTGPVVSFVALNRFVEEKAAKDSHYRRGLEQDKRPVLSQARAMSDEDLVARLARAGLQIDRASLSQLTEHAWSAEEVARQATASDPRPRLTDPFADDWIWFGLTVLWERWLPERPHFERLDDRIQAGYASMNSDPVGACERWQLAWDDFRALFARGGFTSIDSFDRRFRGSQCVSNWVQDFEMELGDAAVKEPRWHAQRIALCEEYLKRFSGESDLTAENMRRALAETTFRSAGNARGDALYQQWLEGDPRWGWGWIGWADNYFLLQKGEEEDLPRAEALLKQGLAVPDVRDREDILERLASLCSETGRNVEAKDFQGQCDAIRSGARRAAGSVLSVKTKVDFGGEGLPLEQLPNVAAQLRGEHERLWHAASLPPSPRAQKVGRNDPCPCGSGRKFKKCCGA